MFTKTPCNRLIYIVNEIDKASSLRGITFLEYDDALKSGPGRETEEVIQDKVTCNTVVQEVLTAVNLK